MKAQAPQLQLPLAVQIDQGPRCLDCGAVRSVYPRQHGPRRWRCRWCRQRYPEVRP